MPRKKLYERKVSTYMEKVHLFEVTESYVKSQTKITGQSRAEVIRDMCEAARLEELTHGQFSSGTTKVFQSVTNKRLKQNLDDPLARIGAKLTRLEGKVQEMELNARFGDEEIFGVMRAFYIENQMLARLLYVLLESNKITVDIAKEREVIRAKYASDFNTRQDAFFTKYERLFMEKLIGETTETEKSAQSDVIDASQTD